MSRSEKKIIERLDRIGIEAFVPFKTEVRQWSDRKKVVKMPLISGYVFVRISETERHNLLEVPGVVQFVKFCQKDANVSEKEIETLRVLEQKGYYLEVSNSGRFENDVKAKITAGPFKGLQGILKRGSGRESYYLSIKELDYIFCIKAPNEILEIESR